MSKILQDISNQLAIDVDSYCDNKWKDGFRSHLGASEIGDECQRKLWYRFRWFYTPKFDPRLKRLFNRGHLEEDRFVDYLRGIGCEVQQFDMSYRLLNEQHTNRYTVKQNPNLNEALLWVDVSNDLQHIKNANNLGVKYPVQWSVSAVEGHFGGSCDGLGYLPKEYNFEHKVLFEFKTANEKSTNALIKEKVRKNKPLHYSQMCVYGYLFKVDYAVYNVVCKNDDRLYYEVIPLNHKTGEVEIMKADRIIKSKEPPPRLFENPTYYVCKMCPAFAVCHANKPAEVNCRSCKHSEPAKNAQWICNKHNTVIPEESISGAYSCWESII